MKSLIFSNCSNALLTDVWLLMQRIVLSVMMLTHGWPKLLKLMAGETNFPDPLGVGSVLSLILAVVAEVIAPLLIVLGIATRLSSILVIITMAVAAFIVHMGDPFGQKEMALLYLAGFTGILIMGAGRFSIDRHLK